MILRFTVIAMILAMSSQADTLRLRNGSVVNGTFLGGTADDVRFSVDNDIRHYQRADVEQIVFAPSNVPSSRSEAPTIDLGPDIAGAPFLRGASGYIPLERQIGMMSRGGGGIYGGGGNVYRIQGPRSPVRVRQGDRIVFVVRLDGGGDPRQFQLYRLESRMGYRQTQVTMNGTPPPLPMTINRISDSVYEITPGRGLYAGEYAVSPMNSNESYCFGVDY